MTGAAGERLPPDATPHGMMISRSNAAQQIRRQPCLGDRFECGIHRHTADFGWIDETDPACLQTKRNDRQVEKMSQKLTPLPGLSMRTRVTRLQSRQTLTIVSPGLSCSIS